MKNRLFYLYTGSVIRYSILISVGITMMIPFLWMISTSLKDLSSVFVFPPQIIPERFYWSNYLRAWEAVPFLRGYINSIIVSFITTAGQVFTSSLAAYAFARIDFWGRDKIFFAYLATMMIPGDMTMIPVFTLLKKVPEWLNALFSPEYLWWTSDLYLFDIYVGRPLGVDSYFALIAPALFTAYGTFMLRQFFLNIPKDLEHAARIDGCSAWGIYKNVILPLSKPALAALATFTVMGSWRSFIWPLIVTSDLRMKTLPVMLEAFKGTYTTEWNLLMAGSMIMIFPLIIVFLFCQRFFVEGIQIGAVKG